MGAEKMINRFSQTKQMLEKLMQLMEPRGNSDRENPFLISDDG